MKLRRDVIRLTEKPTLVKLHDRLRGLLLGNYVSSQYELNLICAIIMRLNDWAHNIIVVPFNEISEDAKLGLTDNALIADALDSIVQKMRKFPVTSIDGQLSSLDLPLFVFNRFEVNRETNELTMEVNEAFIYLFNVLPWQFTTKDR